MIAATIFSDGADDEVPESARLAASRRGKDDDAAITEQRATIAALARSAVLEGRVRRIDPPTAPMRRAAIRLLTAPSPDPTAGAPPPPP